MKLVKTFAALYLLFIPIPGCLADDMADGKKLYSLGNYNKAAEIFQRAISKNSHDATAHYYLANCYVAKRDFAEARSEYQYAANLTKDVKVRDYCLSLIDDLETRVQPRRQLTTKDMSPEDLSPSMFSQSSSSVPSHMSKSGQAAMQKSSETASAIMAEAELQCLKVMEEKNAALAPMRGANRMGLPFSTAEELQYVSEPYDKRIASIRAAAKARADDAMQEGRARARLGQ